jgi:hypothetical protein
MLQNPRTTKSQFFGKIKIKKGPGIAIIQKLKKSKDFHERADKRIDDLLANYLIFYTF